MLLALAACGTSEEGNRTGSGDAPGENVDNQDGNDDQNNVDEDIDELEKSVMEGYVVQKDQDGRILVISVESTDYSSTGGEDEFYNAIWFSDAPDEIAVGEKVEVTYDIVLTSYPGQSSAQKVVVTEKEQPEGANLTEAEAIGKALQDQRLDQEMHIYAVLAADYDVDEKQWTVQLKEVMSGEDEFTIEVMDE